MLLFDAASMTGSAGRLRVYDPRRRTIQGRELKTWWVRVYDRKTGRRAWKSTGQTDYRSALIWAEEYRASILRDPPRKRRRRTGSATPRILTQEEETRLLDQCDAQWRSLIIFAVETGLRGITLMRLEWKDVDLATGWMTVPGEKQKSKQPLRVPISDRALQALSQLNAQTTGRIWEIQPNTFGRKFSKIALKAGVQGLTFHCLRRTFATRQRIKGTPIEVALALGDWRDLKTFMSAYRAVTPEELQDAVD